MYCINNSGPGSTRSRHVHLFGAVLHRLKQQRRAAVALTALQNNSKRVTCRLIGLAPSRETPNVTRPAPSRVRASPDTKFARHCTEMRSLIRGDQLQFLGIPQKCVN